MKMKVGLLTNEIPPIVYGGVATWIMNFLDMFIDDDDIEIIPVFLAQLDSVDAITVLKTEILAPDQVRLSLEIDINTSLIEEKISDNSVSNIIHQSVKSIGQAINDMEKEIQNRFSNIKYIDLEIN